MWTRLFYLNSKQAFKGEMKDGKYIHRAISGRYTALLKKQFRIHDVPWNFTKIRSDETNPRNSRTPKGHKVQRLKQIKYESVMKNLQTADEEINRVRQQKLNDKKLTGFDWILSQTAPSWIQEKKVQVKVVKALKWNANQNKNKDER